MPHRFSAFVVALIAGAALLGQAGAAIGDIYGYVDERGVAHLSNVPLDQRYYLFKKEPSKVTVLPGRNAIIMRVPAPAPRRTTHVNPSNRKQYTSLISTVAREHKLDAALLHAVVTVESGYNPRARSPKGAMGLMQLMPDTAKRYAVGDVWDPG